MGQSGAHINFTAFGTIEEHQLGEVFRDDLNDKTYQYIYNNSATTMVVGCNQFHEYTTGYITADTAGAAAVRNRPAGWAISAIPYQSYGFIQTWGPHLGVVTNGDDDIAKGNWIVGASNVSGLCDSVAQGAFNSFEVFGTAMTEDVNGSNTVDAYCTILS